MPEPAGRGWLAHFGVGVAIAAVATLVALALGASDFVTRVELATYDWRMRLTARPTEPSSEIVIVAMNDDSIKRLEPVVGRWPWPRLVHAAVIDFLARGPARVIVYDGLFTERDARRFDVAGEEWTGTESDLALAESVARAGTVVLGADAADEGLVDTSKQIRVPLEGIPALSARPAGGECVEPRPVLVPPYEELAKAARALGHTYTILDADGPVRRSVPFVRVGSFDVPSLGVAAASLLGVKGPDGEATFIEQVPTPDGELVASCRALIAYRGPSQTPGRPATFRYYSFYDLFYSEQQILEGQTPELDPGVFKDRIVVIGATASGTFDTFPTPWGLVTPGAEIHANIIDALLVDRRITPIDPWRGFGLALGLALIVGASAAAGSAWVTGTLAALVGTAATAASVYGFSQGVWMPLVAPVTAVGLTFVGQLAWVYFVEGREKRQVKRLFSRYVPKDVYEQLLADPERAALGGKRRTMTVLFSDVRGFTAMSEKASPEEVVGQLNEYFSRMVDVLFAHHGTLDKFVGDMVMGLFGAPLDDPDHAEHAVQTALAMSRALDELNQRWAAAGRPLLDIGIGISTGDMVAGNIGSSAIMSYTVIGDTVNLGARLESLNKEYGTRVIISEATRDALKGQYDIRPLGEVIVKGKSRPVAIYEVKPERMSSSVSQQT
ncbi:MAG TPA: adenylate/guanylate cyclase domain-containing protein [Vicinamibacterales bacterium]|nr:adenylate/guanylate cyclase domain-containing protein [Vicinamibacterales bacterium]